MSVYVSNYQHDIFVSYAQADNESLLPGESGWVSHLISGLKILLGKKLGHQEAFSLWMDHELRGNAVVTPQIYEQLTNSATFLIILSPAYLASQWCRLELNTFLAEQGKESGRLFIVEHDRVERPPPLTDLLGYKFWRLDNTEQPRTLGLPKPSAEEIEYYQRLDDLARQLAEKLVGLNTQAKSSTSNATADFSKDIQKSSFSIPEAAPITVFLAEVTDDLETRRQEVKRGLEQQGIQILPNKVYSYANIQQAIDEDLQQCRLFIQLLSDKTGNNYPQFQYERAKVAQIAILQWREAHLAMTEIIDANHRALLEGSTVIASGLVEFQTHIINQLKKQQQPTIESPEGDSLVFINAAPEDMELAYQVRDILDAHGVGYSLPLDITVATKATEMRYHLEQNLLTCDAVLVLYDNTSIIWVNEQLLYCRRIQRKREQPIQVIAVYNTPTTSKHALNIKLPNMQVLDCPTPHVDTCLPLFLQRLQI